MREAGIDKILFYRTREFDSYCREFLRTSEDSLVDKVIKWENEYRSHIEQLEMQIFKLRTGDLRRLLYLDNPRVIERLTVQQRSYNNAHNAWALNSEQEGFKQCGIKPISTDNLGAPHDEFVY
jgi:hypothetical protein